MYFGRNRRGLPLIYNTHQPLQYNRPLQLENQIKAAESYSRLALCKRWFKLFDSVDEILMSDHTDQLKASEQFFPVTLFIMLYEVQ